MAEDMKNNKCKHIYDIKRNYRRMEEELVTQLNYEVNNHHGTAGGNREEIWKSFFERIIPKKFNIARSVFIIDSEGKVSKEVDIAIYDEQYTPYIFNYGLIKFIPIEAVSAVVQCKSHSLEKENLISWVNSIDVLNTSRDSIARIATCIHIGENSNLKGTQTKTKPIKILCYLHNDKTTSINKQCKENFDIVIESNQKTVEDENKNTIIEKKLNIKFNDENLFDVLVKYNLSDKSNKDILEIIDSGLKNKKIENYEIKGNNNEKYSLLSFIFQFNQMLMMINNPMFFPHISYVNMFNNTKEENKEL